MFRFIDITIDIIFFSINWKNYFDRSILVISMTVLIYTTKSYLNPFSAEALTVRRICSYLIRGDIKKYILI